MEGVAPLLHLNIKAANQKLSDYTVRCDQSWSIRTLKEHLSLVYPGNPIPSDQKLIYSGRLLTDDIILGELISMDQEESTTIHLVWTSKEHMEGASSSSQHVPPQVPQGQNPSYQPYTHPYYQFAPQYMPHVSPDQMALQMAYVQQIYAQYFAMANYYQNQQVPAVQPPVPPPANPPAEPVVEQRAPRVDEEHNNRDWVDWFYIASRALALLSIIYFYSSPGRFLFVSVVATLVYLYHLGYFRVPAVEPQQPDAVQEPDENGPQEIMNAMDGNIEPPRAPPNLQPAISTLATVWSFIVTFFTSLVPENPGAVNAN